MALRTKMSYWKSVLTRPTGGSRSFFSQTTPKLRTFAPTLDADHLHKKTGNYDLVVMVEMGMVVIALLFATMTAKQQLLHSPSVLVTKKRRESVYEVEDPDIVVANADKFVNKSFLRKVAHIQQDKRTLHDPVRPNPFTRPRNAETLKTVGMDPKRN